MELGIRIGVFLINYMHDCSVISQEQASEFCILVRNKAVVVLESTNNTEAIEQSVVSLEIQKEEVAR